MRQPVSLYPGNAPEPKRAGIEGTIAQGVRACGLRRFGKLAVLPVRMNPDLAMGDELLKKTGAGNLFTVFGEPDVKVTATGGKVTVTIRGVDVFDPSTGAVRTGDVDDIPCWFIDTDDDGQAFF